MDPVCKLMLEHIDKDESARLYGRFHLFKMYPLRVKYAPSVAMKGS